MNKAEINTQKTPTPGLQSRFKEGSRIGARRNRSSGKDTRIYKCIGVEQRTRHIVRRFKVLLRTGRLTSVPYALLPIITYDPDHHLVISTDSIEIRITGRGLGKIEEYLSDEKLLWIREASGTEDDEEEEIFVSEIIIDEDVE